MIPWYIRNRPADVRTILSAPAVAIGSALFRTDGEPGQYVGEVLAVFPLWWLIAEVLYPSSKSSRRRRWLVVTLLGSLELFAIGGLLLPYTLSRAFRAYTPIVFLLGYLAWAFWTLWMGYRLIQSGEHLSSQVQGTEGNPKS
jgi:hypothetical protein